MKDRFFSTLLSCISRCAVCGMASASWHGNACPLCPECESSLTPLAGPVCDVCGVPLSSEEGLCLDCREPGATLPLIAKHRSLYLYDHGAASILLAFKAEGWSRLSRFLAASVDAFLDEWIVPGQVVCPVPSFSASVRKRGFDHMQRLCASLSPRHGKNCRFLLVRKGGQAQKHLDRAARKKNMTNCLECNKEPDRHRDTSVGEGTCPVLLIDDVKTTGASLEACASVLASRGWGPISSLSLFLD